MLTVFTGRVGDHNDRAMRAAALLGRRLATRWQLEYAPVGQPEPTLNADWHTELVAATGALHQLAGAVKRAAPDTGWVTIMPRCAGALATVPVIANRRPDSCVVWFDAHADLHTPHTTTSGFLGGMALSGPLGWWDTGFGAGVRADQCVLAGARDIDPAERQLISEHGVSVVPPGPHFVERLLQAVGHRSAYVHLDCDVLEPGTVPTDYQVPGGLTLRDLRAALDELSRGDVAGLEVAELEQPAAGLDDSMLDDLLDAVSPVISRVLR